MPESNSLSPVEISDDDIDDLAPLATPVNEGVINNLRKVHADVLDKATDAMTAKILSGTEYSKDSAKAELRAGGVPELLCPSAMEMIAQKVAKARLTNPQQASQ